ncbi:hypothetical protein LVD15_08955 [Fulvivirga maritima]|uniref:tetratricopeptide repeat protein n=1 Tax=Fulvivirga maritima TaxID=2904247 RepID=UPI001F474CD7|nr:tetratricopeptide repeat protein [Fulvivirga maritima]UII28544.1 hypothetical protein LVD15_08955 [Fulvivirga maritima]
MKAALIIFLGCISIPFYSYSQQDSLVLFSEINYWSDMEKEAFNNFFINDKENYLQLFMAADPLSTPGNYQAALNKIDEEIASINLDKLAKKKVDKKMKILYDQIHEDFFSKYELENTFGHIFSNGYYNCVSATALFSILFNELSIPYTLKESPTHVYMIAYPSSERILVESTDPGGRFFTFDNKFKTDFVNQMKAAKLISDAEYKAKNVSDLFDEYYFEEEDINLKQLVGIQYANDAIYKLNESKYKEAYEQLEKAYLFYPADKVSYMLMNVATILISTADYYESENIKLLTSLTRFENSAITDDQLFGEFTRVNHDILINHGDFDKYKEAYEAVYASAKSDELKNEISFLYNYECGRVLYNKNEFDKAIPFEEEAYKLKKDHVDIEALLVTTIIRKAALESDNLKIISLLQDYASTHPELLENKEFKSVLVMSYLRQSALSFQLENSTEGVKYQKLFENNFEEKLSIDPEYIGQLYTIAGTYYFKKGQTNKARETINTGLKYAPGNNQLLLRQKLLR